MKKYLNTILKIFFLFCLFLYVGSSAVYAQGYEEEEDNIYFDEYDFLIFDINDVLFTDFGYAYYVDNYGRFFLDLNLDGKFHKHEVVAYDPGGDNGDSSNDGEEEDDYCYECPCDPFFCTDDDPENEEEDPYPDPCEENPDDCYYVDDGDTDSDSDTTEKDWYSDGDGDGYHTKGTTAIKSVNKPTIAGTWAEGTSSGEDCDDTKPEVHKLNKCQKCEPEPTNGKCKDCVDDNTNNQYDVDPSTGELSQEGIDLLKGIETLALQPYDDTNPNGGTLTAWNKHATIGYGHLIRQSEWDDYKNGITETEAEDLFTDDIDLEITSLRDMSGSLTQNQFDALAIFSFNIGGQNGGGFDTSSARKMLEDCEDEGSNYDTLEAAWKAFNKQGGTVVLGLNNRRNAEWNIFVDGVYEQW